MGTMWIGSFNSSQITPSLIQHAPSNIVQFVCGSDQNLFLDSEGNVYSCGAFTIYLRTLFILFVESTKVYFLKVKRNIYYRWKTNRFFLRTNLCKLFILGLIFI